MEKECNSQMKQNEADDAQAKPEVATDAKSQPPKEIGGRKGPDPTRYGDWELKGKCVDF